MYYNYEEKNSIELLITEINKALSLDMYLIALMSVLTIPDALCKIEYGQGGGNNYAKWVDTYVEDCFGVKYGDKVLRGNIANYENGKELEKTDNDRYLESPVSMCGDNCYQLRCSLLHVINNEIKGSKKSGKERKYIWIDECVLQFCSNMHSTTYGYDTYLKELNNGEIVTVAEKYCYINVRELCNDIMRAAIKYMQSKKDNANKLPKIKVNNGGRKMPSILDVERFTNNIKLYKKHIKNMKNKNIEQTDN